MQHNRKDQRSGFSIIEIMVFVSLITIILVAAAGYTVKIIQNMSYNQHKIYATRYVEDVKEWLDGEREADWTTFEGKATSAGATYCLNGPITLVLNISSLSALTNLTDCTYSGITGQTPAIFKRTLLLTKSGTSVTALITVSWYENTDLRQETLETVYSVWQ